MFLCPAFEDENLVFWFQIFRLEIKRKCLKKIPASFVARHLTHCLNQVPKGTWLVIPPTNGVKRCCHLAGCIVQDEMRNSVCLISGGIVYHVLFC